MGWRKLRIYRELENEQTIVSQHGWPSQKARDALLLLYASKIRNATKRTTKRWVSSRVTLEDLVQEVFSCVLERAYQWNPQVGAFSGYIEVWGIYAIQQHIARFRYPMPQGRRIGYYRTCDLSISNIDDLIQPPSVSPIPSGLLFRAIEKRITLTTQEQTFMIELAQGATVPDVCRETGVSRQRGFQVRANIEKKLRGIGAHDGYATKA